MERGMAASREEGQRKTGDNHDNDLYRIPPVSMRWTKTTWDRVLFSCGSAALREMPLAGFDSTRYWRIRKKALVRLAGSRAAEIIDPSACELFRNRCVQRGRP